MNPFLLAPSYRPLSRRWARILLAVPLLLATALPPAVEAETYTLPVRSADAERLDALGQSVQQLGAGMPAAAELALSTAVPLTPSAAGREADAKPGDAWLAAGVETVSVAAERAPGQPLYEPSPAQRLALFEIRFEAAETSGEAGSEAGAARSAVRSVAAPAVTAPMLRSPRPLIRDGAVDGIAWLQGDGVRSLAVRFAPRFAAGGTWGEAETVASPGPGSQLALAAAHLGDGSTLLAWSRFDGRDDEIFWSLRRDGAWTEPRRITTDDATPDVTPVLLAVPGGALAAWAGYEGDGYRVFLARWDGEGWSEPTALPGPGTFPSFEAVAGEAAGGAPLLYRSGDSWRVIEIDGAGHPVRQARLRAAGHARPRVTAVDGGGPTLRWSNPTSSSLGRSMLRWESLPDAEVTPEATSPGMAGDAGEGSR